MWGRTTLTSSALFFQNANKNAFSPFQADFVEYLQKGVIGSRALPKPADIALLLLEASPQSPAPAHLPPPLCHPTGRTEVEVFSAGSNGA